MYIKAHSEFFWIKGSVTLPAIFETGINFFSFLQSSKPIMEKRRRARINESLGQLKMLILEALKKDVRISPRHRYDDCFEQISIVSIFVTDIKTLQTGEG